MTRNIKPVYALAALLALGAHAALLLISWEGQPLAKVQSRGAPGVEIRLAATPAPAPLPVLEPEAPPEPQPQSEVPIVPQAAPPKPTPVPRATRPKLPDATNAVQAPAAHPATPPSPAQPAASSVPASPGAESAPSSPEPLGALENKSPQYPKLARQRGQEGEVTLRVEVSAQGQAMHVSVLKSSGHSLLDKAALEAVRKWSFRPASLNGGPIPGEAVVSVEFRLE